MTEKDDHPAASHIAFPYYFSDVEGIQLIEITITITSTQVPKQDLYISYSGMTPSNYIKCWCSRWDVSDYTVTIETWLDKGDLNILVDNLRPGAVSELYQVLGRPFYYDKSWTGANTIMITPNPSSSSNLKNMRKEIIIYPKNISSSPIVGLEGIFSVKIDGYISGSL